MRILKCFKSVALQTLAMNNLDIRKAALESSRIIDRFGITNPEDIRLKDIAFALGVEVIEGRLEGAAASLVRHGDKAVIRINHKETDPNRKRFSIAHELGHFVLRHGHKLHKVCSAHDLNTWYGGSEEMQANTFAAELLLPTKFVNPLCDVDAPDISFNLIRKIAKIFRASLTATAIRFVSLCPEPCAIVCSKESKISWSWRSEEWKFFIAHGVPLDQETVAYDLHRGEDMPDRPIEVSSSAWGEWKSTDYIMEHSVSFPRLGFVLSLLWVENHR